MTFQLLQRHNMMTEDIGTPLEKAPAISHVPDKTRPNGPPPP